MNRRRALLLVGAASAAPAAAFALQDKIELPDWDPTGASPVYDLADLPVGVTLLQIAALKFQSVALHRQLTAGLNALQPEIEKALAAYPAGYLLHTNIFVNDDGAAAIPGNQIVTPIGVGLEPADALAEYLRVDRIGPAPPTGFRNDSFYLWVYKANGKLTAKLIDQTASVPLDQTAGAEARRRNLLKNFKQALPKGAPDIIQRADFWADLYKRRMAFIMDQALRDDIAALNQQAAQLQTEINGLLVQYHDTLLAMEANQATLDVLNKIGLVVSIINNGMKLDNAMCSVGGAPAQPLSSAAPSGENETLIFQRTTTQTDLNGAFQQIREEIRVKGGPLNSVNQQLIDMWTKSGAATPTPDPIRLP